MERLRILPILLALATVTAFCAPTAAQTVQQVSASPPKVKEVTPVEQHVPFSLGADANTHSIEFRTVDQMTQKDRDLVADAESSISEHAGFLGLEFNGGKWSYRQVICPALPNHIFLQFTRNNGTGDVSAFSASIPRASDGKVRIVPILLRGYSLFSPAPVNALTISAFNHIRAEEHADSAPEWLGTGLCYAALAGGHPQAGLPAEDSDSLKFRLAMPARLEIPQRGNVILAFADVSATPRPMEWTMIFNRKGRLLKAAHRPAELIPAKVIHPTPMVMKGNLVQPVQETAGHVPDH
jgi:hypothetical protein